MKAIVHLKIEGVIELERDTEISPEGFGEWLRENRLKRRLTLKELSQISGVSASHLGRIERGERVPGYCILAKLRQALGE